MVVWVPEKGVAGELGAARGGRGLGEGRGGGAEAEGLSAVFIELNDLLEGDVEGGDDGEGE